jgi:hypothetical protein
MRNQLKSLHCASKDCGKPFTQVDYRQMYCSGRCLSREKVRRWRARHKAQDHPPPSKPPGRAHFGKPKLLPSEAALNFGGGSQDANSAGPKAAAA